MTLAGLAASGRFARGVSLLALAVAPAVLSAACGGDINRRTAQSILLSVPEFSGKGHRVQVFDVSKAGADRTLVTADIRTTMMLRKEKGGWRLEEIRLPDGTWVRVDAALEAVLGATGLETRSRMLSLATAILRAREAGVKPGPGLEMGGMTDLLVPRFLDRPVRADAWGTDFRYGPRKDGRMELRSAGPDRSFDTPDDIVLVDGFFL